jgi:ABC-type transport system substrate-binding protein
MAGGKVAKIDRIEWKSIPDHQTAVNALLAGEIDMIETPPHDLYPVLKADANVKLFNANPLGNQYTFRFNTLHKPLPRRTRNGELHRRASASCDGIECAPPSRYRREARCDSSGAPTRSP